MICSLGEYLDKHRERIDSSPNFAYEDYDINALTPERRRELVAAVARGGAYITGGRSAELRGEGGTTRTPASAETIKDGRATLKSEPHG